MGAKRFCLFLTMVLVLFCSAGASWAKQAIPSDKENRKAKELFQTGDYQGALLAYERLDRRDHRPRFLLRIGQCHLKLGQWKESLVAARGFLEQEPEARGTYRSEADEVIKESSQRLSEEESRQRVELVEPTKDVPIVAVAARPEQKSARTLPIMQERRDLFVDVRLPRPRWRLGVGSVLLSGGLVTLGVGSWALWANGRPAQGCSGAPPVAGDFCGYQTQGLGAALVSVGAAAVIGGTVMLAWPGPRGSKPARLVGLK